MTDSEFTKYLGDKLDGKILKQNKNVCYVLSFGADDAMWLLQRGVIITEHNNSDGTQIGTGVYGPGMMIGVTAVNGESGIVNCKPLKDAVVVGYRTKDILKLMNENQEITMYLLKFMCGRFRFLMRSLEMNSLRSISERIHFFEKLIKDFGDEELMDFSDNVIAEYLGIHPASISRARKQEYSGKQQKKELK